MWHTPLILGTLCTRSASALPVATLSRSAFAQMDQGTIAGIVVDSTGAAVPKAKVKLVDAGNGFALERTADGGGSYTFTPLKIGTYTITATAPGFRGFEQQGINVTAGSRADVPLDAWPCFDGDHG